MNERISCTRVKNLHVAGYMYIYILYILRSGFYLFEMWIIQQACIKSSENYSDVTYTIFFIINQTLQKFRFEENTKKKNPTPFDSVND